MYSLTLGESGEIILIAFAPLRSNPFKNNGSYRWKSKRHKKSNAFLSHGNTEGSLEWFKAVEENFFYHSLRE